MSTVIFGNKKLGFGAMRLPMVSGAAGNMEAEVDAEQVKKMVDIFLERGFTYFDTAHGYIGTRSEPALREALVKRYPRSSYILTNKLSSAFWRSREDILPLCRAQLEACGTDYFDNYLMHAMTAVTYEKYHSLGAFEEAQRLKEMGLIRHIGISFHDKAELLEQILSEHPEIEMVQIQLNYADYDNPTVQSRMVYEVCVKHEKPVIVMEPVKGGSLVKLPDSVKQVFDELNGGSYASYAIRFAASHENVKMVLSGMSRLEEMLDNTGFMAAFTPLSCQEQAAVQKAAEILRSLDVIPCTACRYCVTGCPKNILIPDLFACMNAKTVFGDFNSTFYYGINTSGGHGKASDCVRCGQCEQACPQHLEIRSLLEKTAKVFDKA